MKRKEVEVNSSKSKEGLWIESVESMTRQQHVSKKTKKNNYVSQY